MNKRFIEHHLSATDRARINLKSEYLRVLAKIREEQGLDAAIDFMLSSANPDYSGKE